MSRTRVARPGGRRTSAARRLPRRELARALRLGLGRARLDVRRHGIEGRFDLLVATCLRDTTLDRQMEGSLAGWLTDVARDGRCLRALSDRVIRAWHGSFRREKDQDHVARMLTHLGMSGDRKAVAALRTMLGRGKDDGIWLACSLVQADGERGWRDATRSLAGQWPRAAEGDLAWLASVVREEVGARRALAVLDRMRDRAPDGFGARMRDAIRAAGRRVDWSARRREEPATLDELETLVRAKPWRWIALHGWARRASAEDVAEAWRRALAERSTKRLRRRLDALVQERAPRYRPAVVRLTRHPNRFVRGAAWGLLAVVRDPRVRTLALRALRRDPGRAIDDGAIEAFELNARDEDAAVLAAVLPQRGPPKRLHSWVKDVHGTAVPGCAWPAQRGKPPRPRLGPAWTALLLGGYEVSPCRWCREFVLDDLVERGAAPRALLREALWDASPEVRAVARKALAGAC